MGQERKPFLFGVNRNTHHDGQSASPPSSVTKHTPLTRRTTQGRGGNAPRGRGGPAKRGGGGGGSSAQNSQEKPKREAILDLSKYVNTEIKITFQGGRQGILDEISPYFAHTTLVTGTLKGFDQLLNLVLDNVEEHSSGPLLSSTFELSPKSVDFRSMRRGPRAKQEARLSSIKGSHYHSHQPH